MLPSRPTECLFIFRIGLHRLCIAEGRRGAPGTRPSYHTYVSTAEQHNRGALAWAGGGASRPSASAGPSNSRASCSATPLVAKPCHPRLEQLHQPLLLD